VISRGGLNTETMKRVVQAGQELHALPLYVIDSIESTRQLPQIIRAVRRYQGDFGVKVFGLDYIQLLYSGKAKVDSSDMLRRLTDVSQDLAAFLKVSALDCIACAQLGRQVEHRADKRPTSMSDLKEAGAFEQDADLVAGLWRPAQHGIEAENGQKYPITATEWIVLKNRPYDIFDSIWTGLEEEPINQPVLSPIAAMPRPDLNQDLPF